MDAMNQATGANASRRVEKKEQKKRGPKKKTLEQSEILVPEFLNGTKDSDHLSTDTINMVTFELPCCTHCISPGYKVLQPKWELL